MANIWRRKPSYRLMSRNLVRKSSVDASTIVASTFFEFAIVETIIANEFPMYYYQNAKELRSRVAGAAITKVASNFPSLLQKSGKAKELTSKWN